MISNQEKKILKESVALMWDCYQKIAQTPQDDHWTRIFIKARDIHQELLSREAKEG